MNRMLIKLYSIILIGLVFSCMNALSIGQDNYGSQELQTSKSEPGAHEYYAPPRGVQDNESTFALTEDQKAAQKALAAQKAAEANASAAEAEAQKALAAQKAAEARASAAEAKAQKALAAQKAAEARAAAAEAEAQKATASEASAQKALEEKAAALELEAREALAAQKAAEEKAAAAEAVAEAEAQKAVAAQKEAEAAAKKVVTPGFGIWPSLATMLLAGFIILAKRYGMR